MFWPYFFVKFTSPWTALLFFYSRMTRYFSCKESYTPQFQKEKQICHCHPFHFVWRRQMSQHCSHAEHLIEEMLNFKKQMNFGLNCCWIQWKWFLASTLPHRDTSFCFRSSVHFLLAFNCQFQASTSVKIAKYASVSFHEIPHPQTFSELPRPERCTVSKAFSFKLVTWVS